MSTTCWLWYVAYVVKIQATQASLSAFLHTCHVGGCHLLFCTYRVITNFSCFQVYASFAIRTLWHVLDLAKIGLWLFMDFWQMSLCPCWGGQNVLSRRLMHSKDWMGSMSNVLFIAWFLGDSHVTFLLKYKPKHFCNLQVDCIHFKCGINPRNITFIQW